MGRVLEDDRKLRADNIFRSVAECDEFCNKPRRACGNRCRARITVCEAQGIKCHPWLCRAFCRGNRSSRYCQNRQIPSDECNRYRKGCSCQNYIGGATEAYDPVSGLTAFFDYSTNEVVVRWDKVQGPKLYDVRITKDNTKVKKLIARGSTKRVEAALFDLDETYDVAVRRKRGKMMGSSPYVSILYKHIVDESQMHKAQDDQVSTTEDHVGDITGNILNNDSDPDFGHTLTVDLHRVSGPPGSRVTYSGDDLSMIITLANGSTLNLRANGNYIFRRASGSYQDLSGTQSEYEEFKYAVDDGHGNSAEAILEVRVDGANDAPIALNDIFVHSSSDPTSIEDVADGCVLENDKDIDIGDVANLAVCVVNGVEIQNDIHQHVDLGQHTKLSIGADGCFTISGLATEYQYLAKGETADVCFFYQACDSHQDISTSYKSNVAEACVRVEGFYEGQDYCLAGNGGCDPLTECENSPGGPVCGPCPSGYSGTGESGCMQNSPCDSFHISVENDAKYTTLLLKGWTNAQVGWEISLSSKATKFELSLPAKDGAEISSLEASVGILESTIADANNTLALPDIRMASGSSCSKDDATLKLTIPSFVSNICFSGGCRPTLCRLPPLPSTLPNYSLVPSNNVKLFGGGHNCTVLQPTFWEEWVEFHFGYSEEFLSEDFYYADPDNDGVMNILEYYGMGEAQLFSDTTDPSGDEDNLCHQDDNDDVIFFGIQSATSYRAGVVELEWTPAFYNSSLEVVEGVFYEIFVATGKFDFSDLGGGLVCPPTISELRQAFQANEKGNFYGHYSTTNTSFVLEGVPPGETISIHAVAVMGSFETSHQYRELTATPTMSSPLRHPTGLVATVASRDPVYASDYQYLEDKNRYIGPLYPSKYCPGFDLDDEDSLEDQGTSMLTLDIIHNIENGTIVFYGEKGANQFEEELWDKIERIVPDDIVSGITGIGTLFQVRIISVNVPGPCSVGTSCYIEVGATSIDIDTIFSELSYNVAYDDVYLNPCHTNYFLQKEAKRNLESDQDSSIEIKKKIFSLNEKYDKKYFGNLVTTRVDFKQSIYFKTEIDFSIFSGIEKARAAAGMDIDLTLTTSFGFDAKFEKKEKRQLWKLKKPIFRYFAINGVYPMWFSITLQLDLEAKVKASAQVRT